MFHETKRLLDKFDKNLAIAVAFGLQSEQEETVTAQLDISSDIFLDVSENKSDDSILELVPYMFKDKVRKKSELFQAKEHTVFKENSLMQSFGFDDDIDEKCSDEKSSCSGATFDSDADITIPLAPVASVVRKSSRLKEVREERIKNAKKLMASKKVMANFSQTSPMQTKTAKSLISSWNEMHRHTVYWMKKFHSREPFSKTALHAHFLNSLAALKRSLSTTRARPFAAHQSIMQFVIDLMKIYEVAFSKGFKEVVGSIFKLVEHVLGMFLAGNRNMTPTSLPWIQSKEVLCLLFSTSSRAETIHGFLQLIGKTQLYFIDRWTKRKTGRNDEFVAFAISEMSFFTNILSHRLSQLSVRNKYALAF